MTLVIKSIALTNMRSHKHLTVDFLSQGVTAITGESGSGKSTIVDSMAWVLYGTKPEGVSRFSKLVHEEADLTKDKCKAVLTFQLDSSIMKVERRLMGKAASATECEVWEKKEGEADFTLVAGPAVSHAEPYIKRRLRMDEKGFLTAVLVQQKSVDDLIRAKASERGEMIEKLMGIRSITTALQEARQNYNSLKKALASSPVDPEAHRRLLEEVGTLEADLAKGEAAQEKLQERLGKVTQDYEASQALLKQTEETEERRAVLQGRWERATGGIGTLEEELSRLQEAKEERRKAMPSWVAGVNLTESEDKLQRLRNDLRSTVQEAATLRAAGEGRAAALQRAQEVLSAHPTTTLKKTEAKLTSLEGKLLKLEEEARALEVQAATLRAEASRSHRAVHVLEEGEGACPTCLQQVSDPEEAVEKLTTEATLREEEAEASLKQAQALQEERAALRQEVTTWEQVREAFLRREEAQEGLEAWTEQKTFVDGKLISLEQELKVEEKNYKQVVQAQEVKAAYDRLLRDATATSDRIEALRGKVKGYEEELKALGSSGNVATLRSKHSLLLSKREEHLAKASALREEVALLGERLKHTRQAEQQAATEAKAYRALMESVEAAGGALAVIEEFRQERIRSSVPLVGAYATDLLTRFTEGRFMALRLDEKFNSVVVTNSGKEREVGMLSGGELSAAGLALRVAIALLLNRGNEQVPLILDEAFASQDKARLETMLHTITDLFEGQVILISHGANTKEIADAIIEL